MSLKKAERRLAATAIVLTVLLLTGCAKSELRIENEIQGQMPEDNGREEELSTQLQQAAISEEAVEEALPAEEVEEKNLALPIEAMTRTGGFYADPSVSGDGRTLDKCLLYPAPTEAVAPLSELPQNRSIRIHVAVRVTYRQAEEKEVWYLISDKLEDNDAGWVHESDVQIGLPSSEAIEYPGPYRIKDGTTFYFVDSATYGKTELTYDSQIYGDYPLWNHGFDENVWLWRLVGRGDWTVWVEDLSGIEDYPGEVSSAP